MKKLLLALFAASLTLLTACGKTEQGASASPAKSDAKVEAKETPRAATYNPNLKPAEIVWDSPEKKKAWEARQAELKKQNKQAR